MTTSLWSLFVPHTNSAWWYLPVNTSQAQQRYRYSQIPMRLGGTWQWCCELTAYPPHWDDYWNQAVSFYAELHLKLKTQNILCLRQSTNSCHLGFVPSLDSLCSKRQGVFQLKVELLITSRWLHVLFIRVIAGWIMDFFFATVLEMWSGGCFGHSCRPTNSI